METTVITPEHYVEHSEDLEAYHRLRHDIFVSLAGLGRQDLYAAAGHETDIWDLPHFHPAHFLVRHNGQPVGVGRMTSSIRPTMMEVIYDDFVDGPMPKAQSIWEVQRLGVDLSLSPELREMTLLSILIAMEDYCFKNSIDQLMLLTFVGIARKRLPDMSPMGQVGEHLGFPHVALIGTPDPVLHAQKRHELARLEANFNQEKAA